MTAASRVRKLMAAVAFLAVLAIFLPPFVNANRFRKRLAISASGALGRSVTLGDVKVRLLPRPGFDIKEFVVADDPAFGAEPLLRAEQVTATLRVLSLWQGKFEIAQLDLAYPSLNLVRNNNGVWNIESLLRYTSALRASPTGRTKAEAAPRFPYVQATSGRINFKILQEKKVHALADADFALWLESENQWNMRLEGRPMRTDANLNDTGTIRIEGSMRRGETLGKSALQMRLTMANSQLGQFTTLLTGKDHGLRGNIDLDATATGTAEKLEIVADAKISDFRRYDIASTDPLSLRSHCTAALTQNNDANMQPVLGAGPALSAINCIANVGSGLIALSGATGVAANPNYELKLELTNLPASATAALLRKTKRNIPDDLHASGVLSGHFELRKNSGEEATIAGTGHADALRFTSKFLDSNLSAVGVNFGFNSALPVSGMHPAVRRLKKAASVPSNQTLVDAPALRIDPFTVTIAGSEEVTCTGTIRRPDYSIKVKGSGNVLKLLAAARTLGFGYGLPFAKGRINFDISLDGLWSGFAAAGVSGTAQLQNVSIPVHHTNAIIQIASAHIALSSKEIAVERLAATISGARTIVQGTMNFPRTCETATCPVRFDLQASEINFDDLNRVLNPKFSASSTWATLEGQFLGGESYDPSKLLQFDAIGRLGINRLLMKSLAAAKVAALLEVSHGKISAKSVQSEILGGRYAGEWAADFTGNQPVYSGGGVLENLALPQLNALTHTSIGSGVISNAVLRLQLAGSDTATLKKSATGQITFNWTNGTISGATPTGKLSTLQFSAWQARADIGGEKISSISGLMRTPDGAYATTGSASFTHDLDLRLAPSSAGELLSITGTLEAPVLNQPDSRLESASNGKDAKPSKTP